MINTSHPRQKPSKELCQFLIDKIGISENAVNLGVKQCSIENAPLPIILWSFGLITLKQFKVILTWQKEHRNS